MRRIAFSPMLAGLLFAAPVAAQTNFSEYASPFTTEYQATYGAPLLSGGFEFYAVFGSDGTFGTARNALGTWGQDPGDPGSINNPTNLGSATTIFGTTTGAWIDMTAAGSNFGLSTTGPAFNLFSIDVAHLFSRSYVGGSGPLGAFSLTFFACPVITCATFSSQTFTIPAVAIGGDGDAHPFLNTLTFNESFRNVQRVAWQQSGTTALNHQFTGVSAVVPEPGTYVLMATGLIFVVGMVRRRRIG